MEKVLLKQVSGRMYIKRALINFNKLLSLVDFNKL
jgi:hypothetical protein